MTKNQALLALDCAFDAAKPYIEPEMLNRLKTIFFNTEVFEDLLSEYRSPGHYKYAQMQALKELVEILDGTADDEEN
jgi:hypothetical protein